MINTRMVKIKVLMIVGMSLCSLAQAAPLPLPWYSAGQLEAGLLDQPSESTDAPSGGIGYLRSVDNESNSGSVLQTASPAQAWLGRRVRLTGKLKTDLNKGQASMFMTITHGQDDFSYDDMGFRKLQGQLDWQTYSIVLDVPYEANAVILFGVSMDGKGELNFGDFNFEVVGYDVEVTGSVRTLNRRSGPKNLGFEDRPD